MCPEHVPRSPPRGLSRAPRPQDFTFSRLRSPSLPSFVGRRGVCANSGAECTLSELRGPLSR
eukprot:7447419-Alexandrium_andersonii.AAC.1